MLPVQAATAKRLRATQVQTRERVLSPAQVAEAQAPKAAHLAPPGLCSALVAEEVVKPGRRFPKGRHHGSPLESHTFFNGNRYRKLRQRQLAPHFGLLLPGRSLWS